MDQGDAAMSKKDYAAALKAYQTADQLMKVPTTGLAVARAQAEGGKLLEARDTALRVTRIPVKDGEPGVFATARSEASALADGLAARIPSLTVTVDGGPVGGARVTIDGVELPPSLLGVARKLNPGKHRVIATAPGHAEARAEVNLAERAGESVVLKLEPAAGAEGPGPVVAPGPVTDSGGDDGRGLSPLVYVGFGVGAAGIAVGSITGLMSLSKASSAKEQCDGNTCPTSAQDDADSSKTLANISNVGFGVGLVGIGIGIYGLLSSGSSGSESQPMARARPVEPLVGARFVGVRGSF
jgi:hypothetical protein